MEITTKGIIEVFEELYHERGEETTSEAQVKQLPQTNYPLVFFFDALQKLSRFGKTEFPNPNKVLPFNKLLVCNQKDVSISNFSIIGVRFLYLRALLNCYPEDNNWSIPAVRHILNGVLTGYLHAYLVLHQKTRIWTDIKLFTNMVYGSLRQIQNALSVYSPELTDEQQMNMTVSIVNHAIDTARIKDKVIAIDCDTILVKEPLRDIKNGNTIYLIIESSESSEVYRELNKICRKLKIDIVK